MNSNQCNGRSGAALSAFFLALFFLFPACKQEENLSPAQTLEKWQRLIDENQFEAAKQYSTSAAIRWIEEVAAVFGNQESGETLTKTVFESISCVETGDSATCFVSIRDGEFLIPDTLHLLRENKRWKIDIRDEPLAPPTASDSTDLPAIQ